MEKARPRGARSLLVAPLSFALLLAAAACAHAPTPQERERSLETGDEALKAGNLPEAERAFGELAAADPNDVRAAVGLGLARLRLGRTADALVQFDRATALQPDNADHAYLRAATLARLGRRDESIEAYRALLAAHPGHSQGATDLLGQLVEAKRLPEARDLVADALRRSPRDYDLLLMEGRIRGLSGDHAASVADYERARDIRPWAPQPVYGLIEAYRNTGRIDESAGLIKVFEDLQAREKEVGALRAEAERNPADEGPAARLLERLYHEGRLDEAVQRTVELAARVPRPSIAGALSLRGARAALATGRTDTARDLLQTAETAIATPGRDDFIAMAEVHEGLGEVEQALALFDRYLQERPDDPRALLGMGRAAMRAGKLDLAEAPLKRAIALGPDDAAAHAAYGLLRIKKGDSGAGEAELKLALQREADQPDALFGLGFLAHMRRQNAEAERYLRRAVAKRPGDASALVILGLVLSEKDACDEAIPMFSSALESDHRNQTTRLGLVRCLERTGRSAEAAAQRKIAEEIAGQPPATP